MNLAAAIIDAIIIGFIFNYGIFLLLAINLRGASCMLPNYFMRGGYKPTSLEIRNFYKLYVPILILIAILMIVNGARMYSETQIDFWGLFWHGYIVAMGMNLGDALFLDLLLFHTHRQQYAKLLQVPPERFYAKNMLFISRS